MEEQQEQAEERAEREEANATSEVPDAGEVRFTNCCAGNKQVLRTLFLRASADARAAFAKAGAYGKLDPARLRRFKALEQTRLQQINAYIEMLDQIADEQFHKAGARQLWQMLDQNQTNLLHNIAELQRDLGAMVAAPD